jgi:hypothetical protein
MRRTLRFCLCQCLVAGLALPLTAAPQETRGKISGTVRDSAGVVPGASLKIEHRYQRQPERDDESVRLFRGVIPQSRHLRRQRADARLQGRCAQRHHPGRRRAVDRAVHPRRRTGQRRDRGHGGDSPARHDVSKIGRPVRHPPGGEPADVLQHADHPVAFCAGHQRERSTDAGVPGLRRQHGAIGEVRPGPAARRHTADASELRRQQLHAGRREQQRQQPAHRSVAELRHDSNGLTGFFSFNANSVRYNRTVEEYERAPALWQGSNDARPWRLAGAASYELPFGRGRRLLSNGGARAALASNWQISGTWEYQPGALLDWDAQNIFFSGDLGDVAVDQWAGPTLNPTSTQFGQVTNVALNQMRFFTFGVRGTFSIGASTLLGR